MKTFTINRDSWHYKINKNFLQDNFMERGWEPKHASFCKYWSATMVRIVAAGGLVSTLALFLFVISSAIWYQPFVMLIVAMVIIGIIGTILGIAVLVDHIQSRPAKDTDREPKSMMAMKYYSFKNKICPMIEFKSPKK